ncbi:MAG: biotin--[acetyl-CoA-carboxylase] ligase [Clostridia bacterium]
MRKFFLNNLKDKQGISLPCFFYSSLSSTMTQAKQLALSGVTCGCVIANKQTGGRGRFDRTFLSKRGKGIYLTFFSTWQDCSTLPILSGLVSLAVQELLSELDIVSSIKWPNDLLIDGKKICGVLCESIDCGQRIVLLGVGVNVNYVSKDLAVLPNRATSIRILLGKRYNTLLLAERLTQKIASLVNNFDLVKDKFRQDYIASCITLGKTVSFTENEVNLVGTAVSLTSELALVIKVGNQEHILNYGEINLQT